MAPKSIKGKVFMQDKEKLLHLAETISAGKELDIQHKVDRTKATVTEASHDKFCKHEDSKHRKRAASEKLRAAKELVATRQSHLKREKIKARKRQVQTAKVSRESDESNSTGGASSRKRVSFA